MEDQRDFEDFEQDSEAQISEPTNKYPAIEDSWYKNIQQYQPQVNYPPADTNPWDDEENSPESPNKAEQYEDLLNASDKNVPYYKADTADQENTGNFLDVKPMARGYSLEEFTDLDFSTKADPEPKREEKPASQKVENQKSKELNLYELEQVEMVESVVVPQGKPSETGRMTASKLFPESLDDPAEDDTQFYSLEKTQPKVNKWGVVRQASFPQENNWSQEGSQKKVVEVSQLTFEKGEESYVNKNSAVVQSKYKYEPPQKEQQEEESDEESEEEKVEVIEDVVAIDHGFADDDMLYPGTKEIDFLKQSIMRMSKTIETQTNDQELHKHRQTIHLSNYDIMIPEEKVIKDGYYYTYILYTLKTQIFEDEAKEYTVHRRYNDFKLLFEVLEKKYKGYVIPLLPPKNFLTTINKESAEFSDTRKKELVDFLKKCMQHPFIKTTNEMFTFLTDDKGFHNFIKREQQTDAHRKNFDVWSVWEKVNQVVHLAAKATHRKRVYIEKTALDNELQNHESSLESLQSRLQSFYEYMLKYLVLKRKNISNLLFFTKKLNTLAGKKRGDTFEDMNKSLKNSTISSVEDKLIRDLTDLAENQLRGILKTVEAMIYSLKKRSVVIDELHELQALIEEQDLNVKKNLATQEQLEDLKRQYEVLKEKFQELSKTLLGEVEYFRENISEDLARFVQAVYDNNEKCLSEALQLWLKQKPIH